MGQHRAARCVAAEVAVGQPVAPASCPSRLPPARMRSTIPAGPVPHDRQHRKIARLHRQVADDVVGPTGPGQVTTDSAKCDARSASVRPCGRLNTHAAARPTAARPVPESCRCSSAGPAPPRAAPPPTAAIPGRPSLRVPFPLHEEHADRPEDQQPEGAGSAASLCRSAARTRRAEPASWQPPGRSRRSPAAPARTGEISAPRCHTSAACFP